MEGIKGTLAHLASYGNIIALAIVFAGDAIVGMLGGLQRLPTAIKNAYQWSQENKMYFFFMMFLGSSMIQTQMMASGAFEIYVNGNLEFSKLNSKQMPTWPVVMDIMSKYGVHLRGG